MVKKLERLLECSAPGKAGTPGMGEAGGDETRT